MREKLPYCNAALEPIELTSLVRLSRIRCRNSSRTDAPRPENDGRGKTATSQRRARSPLESLGPFSFRAPVGNGSRGLQRERRRLELFSARSCAVAGLPLGRRRHRRISATGTSTSVSPFASGTKKIPSLRNVFSGLPTGRESRRRCQGVLLLSGRDSDQSLSKISLQVSAARHPYEQLLSENRNPHAAESEYELADTGIFAENRYFDVFRRVCQGQLPRMSWSASPLKSRAGTGPVAYSADAVVPKPLGVG